jgi:uncharacterized protein (TIGR01777 family)
MQVLISGSSGLVGTALRAALERAGHRTVRLARGDATSSEGTVAWDPKAGTIDADALTGIDAAVNLAGAGIGDHRWTEAYKQEILASRTMSTALLARTLATLTPKPAVLLSASAIGWYGDRGDEVLDESSAAGEGFLADVCRAWEDATQPASAAGIRVAHLRTGIVLSAKGGALAKQLPLFRLFAGGRFGGGKQWQSWITIDDEVGAILHLLDHEVEGAVNLTAPNPVRNEEFARTLGAVLHRPSAIPVPAFGPRLVLGSDRADNLLFTSQRVLPAVLPASGYTFQHPTLEEALRAVLDRPSA